MICLANDSGLYLVEALGDTVLQQGPPQAWLDISVCCDDTKQGGHVWVDHATAFGYAANPHLLALKIKLHEETGVNVPCMTVQSYLAAKSTHSTATSALFHFGTLHDKRKHSDELHHKIIHVVFICYQLWCNFAADTHSWGQQGLAVTS